MRITVDVRNPQGLPVKVGKTVEILEKRLDALAFAAAVKVQERARENLSRGYPEGAVDTGALRDHTVVHRLGPMQYRVVSEKDYARYIEFGTGPAVGHAKYFPPPEALKEWARRHGFEPGGEWAIAWKIYHHGTDPKPYLFPALEETRPEFHDRVRALLYIMGLSR